ncbi:hypothetical protein [Changchengzhania lutea]|uniref:hypothetical protein n=1 Tax=Changchengzhania lutea TaxID=2049305 RepID=UPI00115DF37B|nr:hypothetical protein [Changchengzhania lutea]
MKTSKVVKQEIKSLQNVINASMEAEFAYETLKLKTDNTRLYYWLDIKQDITTDFILSALNYLEELTDVYSLRPTNRQKLENESYSPKTLSVSIHDQVIESECGKIDEGFWRLVITEMATNTVNSKTYAILNKQLGKINTYLKLEDSTPLLVG